jgi:inorganic pyrophosphatase
MRVFIQNEVGSCTKNYHDEKLLRWLRSDRVSRPYPYPYGFVLNTWASDGCNVDCFVITQAQLSTGQIVECEPVGLMEQIEDGEEDHNILAGLVGEASSIDSIVEQQLTELVMHVFSHVDGKRVRAGRFLSKEAALEHLARHQDHELRAGVAKRG